MSVGGDRRRAGGNEIGRLRSWSLPIGNDQECPPEVEPDGQSFPSVQPVPTTPFGPQTVIPSDAPVSPICVSSRNVPNRSTFGVKYTRRLPVSCDAGTTRPAEVRPPWPQCLRSKCPRISDSATPPPRKLRAAGFLRRHAHLLAATALPEV